MKLSIITINRNNAAGLRKTMKSVFSQTYRDFEYIVVDGASTDESVEVIRASALQAEGLDYKWISEPDTGIYNAMNKGIEIALGRRIVNPFNRSELVEDKHGEADRPKQSGVENKDAEKGYVLMLNSGDYLVDEHVVERVIPELDGSDIVQGNTIEEREGRVYRNKGYGRSEISIYDVMEGVFLHQASFCQVQLFEKYGYFDETYTIAADTKFFTICLGVHNASFSYINIDITNYDCNGISAATSGPWNKKHWEEFVRLRREMFSPRLEYYLQYNEPKVQIYNKLHEYKWIWNMTMLLMRIHDWLYGSRKNISIEEIK